MSFDFPESVFAWAIGIIITVPLVIIVLGEIIERLKRNNSNYTRFFELARILFFPALVTFLVVRHVLNLNEDNTPYQLVTSLLLIASAYVGFILFNVISAEKDANRWENQVPGLFKTVLRFFVVLYPVYLLSGVWGIDLTDFVTALGVGSLVIALALQDTLSSIVSGFLLVVDKPFAVGDWIEVDGHKGKVIDISWRSTRLQVEQFDVVVIPNLTLIGSSIYNYTMSDIRFRDSLTLGFSYDDPPNKVKQVMLDMVRDSPDIEHHSPAPLIHTTSYDDSSIAYKLYYYVPVFKGAMDQQRIRDDLMTRVYYAAARSGLTIPFPIAVEGRPKDFLPDTDKIESEIFEFFKWNRYFSQLPDEVLQRLAKEVHIAPFAKGETVLHKGASSDAFGLLRSGQLSIVMDGVADEAHRTPILPQMLTLTSGDIVGEMVLMGRRSNLASCVAVTDAEVYNLPPAAINSIIEQHHTFALQLNHLVEKRITLLKNGSGA